MAGFGRHGRERVNFQENITQLIFCYYLLKVSVNMLLYLLHKNCRTRTIFKQLCAFHFHKRDKLTKMWCLVDYSVFGLWWSMLLKQWNKILKGFILKRTKFSNDLNNPSFHCSSPLNMAAVTSILKHTNMFPVFMHQLSSIKCNILLVTMVTCIMTTM